MRLDRISVRDQQGNTVERESVGGQDRQWERELPFGGYCRRCDRVHSIGQKGAMQAALALMAELESKQRIDIHLPGELADPKHSTDILFSDDRGKMFGVLVCDDAMGQQRVVRAYSGQYNGEWSIEGWAPPVLDPKEFHRVTRPVEKEIKRLGRQLERYSPHESVYRELAGRRKNLSRELMEEIFSLYTFCNFRGEQQRMDRVYLGKGLPPTGTGDCCAPKLLNFAARNGLQPRAMTEFYWGRENPSHSRRHGVFYQACAAKCQPILGFLLCGYCKEKNLI